KGKFAHFLERFQRNDFVRGEVETPQAGQIRQGCGFRDVETLSREDLEAPSRIDASQRRDRVVRHIQNSHEIEHVREIPRGDLVVARNELFQGGELSESTEIVRVEGIATQRETSQGLETSEGLNVGQAMPLETEPHEARKVSKWFDPFELRVGAVRT